MPTQVIHVARREYRCDAPFGPCSRRILKGRPYTQLAYKPGERPYKAPTWTYLRACTHCQPLSEVTEEHPAGPCPAIAGDLPCLLAEGHYPDSPHEFQEGLF